MVGGGVVGTVEENTEQRGYSVFLLRIWGWENVSIMLGVRFFLLKGPNAQIFIAIDQSEVRNDQSNSKKVVTCYKIWDPSPKIPNSIYGCLKCWGDRLLKFTHKVVIKFGLSVQLVWAKILCEFIRNYGRRFSFMWQLIWNDQKFSCVTSLSLNEFENIMCFGSTVNLEIYQ